MEFLGWEEANEEEFGSDVRILLVSGDFSRELTTSVLWLSEKGLDIRCVRLRPYKLENELVLQIEQVLPLPEAQDYIIGVREKQRSEAKSRSRDLTRFDVEIDGECFTGLAKRQAIVRIAKKLCDSGTSPEELVADTGRSFNSVWRWAPGILGSDELSAVLKKQEQEGGPAFDARRWFVESDFIIHRDNRTWAFTKKWGTSTEGVITKWLSKHTEAGIKVSRSG